MPIDPGGGVGDPGWDPSGGGGGGGGLPPGLLQVLGGGGFGLGGQFSPYGGLGYAPRRRPFGYYGQVQGGQPMGFQMANGVGAPAGFNPRMQQTYGAGQPIGVQPFYSPQQYAQLQQQQAQQRAAQASQFVPSTQGYANTPLEGRDAEFWASRLLGGNLLYNLAQRGYLTGDPAQSPITEFLRQQASQTSGALQRRAQLAAQTSGLPYGQQGYGWLQGLLSGQGSEAATINNSLAGQYQAQQDFARQLAAGLLGYSPESKYRGGTDWSAILGGLGSAVGGGIGTGLVNRYLK